MRIKTAFKELQNDVQIIIVVINVAEIGMF